MCTYFGAWGRLRMLTARTHAGCIRTELVHACNAPNASAMCVLRTVSSRNTPSERDEGVASAFHKYLNGELVNC